MNFAVFSAQRRDNPKNLV